MKTDYTPKQNKWREIKQKEPVKMPVRDLFKVKSAIRSNKENFSTNVSSIELQFLVSDKEIGSN